MRLCFSLLLLAAALPAQTLTSVTVAPGNVVLYTGETQQYTATCHYSDHADDDCTLAGGVTWKVPAPAIGSITSGGLFTPSPKTADASGYIEAWISGSAIYGYSYLWVKKDGETITSVTVAPGASTVPAGVTFWASAYFRPGPSSTTMSRWVTWSSSNAAVATVDWEGHVTAVAAGTATITASAHGVTGSFALTVTAATPNPSPKTWYVRPDGGSRYDATSNPTGRCDGLHDAADPGSGTNQPCAFGGWKWLWIPALNTGGVKWAISGGDTVILRQNPNGVGNGVPGPCNNGEYDCGYDAGAATWADYYSYGVVGCAKQLSECKNPTIPSGTASQHTRILGENYASCTSKGAKTTLYGTAYTNTVLNLSGASYVDVECIGVSDRSGCSTTPTGGFICQTGVDNWAIQGILVNPTTTNLSLVDVDIHGLRSSGWIGLAGDGISLNRVRFAGNHLAGMNLDPGGSYVQGGGMTASNLLVEWNGCGEEYPVVHALPYANCADQSHAGYGDGIGSADTGGAWSFDKSIFRYNTQDGLDLLHALLPGTTFSVTNSLSYGNMGQQFKLGIGSDVVFRNNQQIGSCRRMAAAMTGTPTGYNQFLSDFCRAGGTALAIYLSAHSTYKIQNNSMVGGNIALELECSGPYGGQTTGDCTGAKIYLQNNIMRGYAWTSSEHPLTTGVYMGNGATLGPIFSGVRDHNLFYNLKTGLQTDCPSSYTGESCADPKFVSAMTDAAWTSDYDQTRWDGMDLRLQEDSPAINTGATIAAVTTDGRGVLRPQGVGYDIGAVEFSTADNAPTFDTPSPLARGVTNTAYSVALSLTGDPPVACSLSSGAFPSGLSVSSGCVISGTIGSGVAAGTYTVTIAASNGAGTTEQVYQIPVDAAPTITTHSVPPGVQNVAYSQTLSASGAGTITWDLAAGTLPTGLSLSSGGVLSGTPTALGSSSVTVRATNSAGSTTQDLTVAVIALPSTSYRTGTFTGR